MNWVTFRTLAVTPGLENELHKFAKRISFVKSLLLQLFFCTYAQEVQLQNVASRKVNVT